MSGINKRISIKLFASISILLLIAGSFHNLGKIRNYPRIRWEFLLPNMRAPTGQTQNCNMSNPDFTRLMEQLCSLRNEHLRQPGLTNCPCPSPHHTCWKDVKLSLQEVTMQSIRLSHPAVSAGGLYQPPCNPVQRVAIIIPVRDRQTHLALLLHHLHALLERQLLAYHIFVAEQTEDGKFNKGLIMNAGFLEAKARFGRFDCYVFHDVDMLAEDDRNVYACTHNVRHIGSHVSKFAYKLIYEGLFGGVIALTEKQFRQVNGFSNNFAGWGGEDDDMYRRMRSRHLSIHRYPSIANYYMLKHGKDTGNPSNHKRDAWKQLSAKEYDRDGLNTAHYRIVAEDKYPLYTRLLINVVAKDKLSMSHRKKLKSVAE